MGDRKLRDVTMYPKDRAGIDWNVSEMDPNRACIVQKCDDIYIPDNVPKSGRRNSEDPRTTSPKAEE